MSDWTEADERILAGDLTALRTPVRPSVPIVPGSYERIDSGRPDAPDPMMHAAAVAGLVVAMLLLCGVGVRMMVDVIRCFV